MRVVVALALIVVGFAGCSEETTPLVLDEEPAPTVVTDPSDYSYNTTRQHIHDYWNDQQSIEVFSKTKSIGTIVFDDYEDEEVRGDTDQVIPQGAKWVNITMDWDLNEPRIYSATELWLRTAKETEPFLVGPIEDGETVTFLSDNGHDDLPHQRLSAWMFILRFYSDVADHILTQGTVDVTVTAARGLEIPVYPGHPDQWKDATELPLLEHEGNVGMDTGPHSVAGVGAGHWCLFQCFGILRLDDGAIVPYNTSMVEVVLSESSGTSTPTLPGLMFHGADTLEWTLLEPSEQSGSTRTYQIEVLPGAGDGAYAQQSLWEFHVVIDEPVPNGVFVGSFDLKARAIR